MPSTDNPSTPPCPVCGARGASVTETRAQPDGSIMRRRYCRVCAHFFVTDEVYEPDPRARRRRRQQENRDAEIP
jgi:transcriptional regulator NrdR family protein